jgi:hypothetical protein
MSLTPLQNDSNVPTAKLDPNGNAYWLNHVLVHVDGASDGTGNGKWSYNSSASHKIKYNSTTKKWEDLADGQPSKISDTYNVNTTAVTGSSTGANPAEVFLWNNNGGQFLGKFANPFLPSGPTVTSITVANEIASTRQFTVTHTGTLSASDISYTLNGTDITTFGSPSTPITNLQSTSTGSTFDSYTLSTQGSHSVNIEDKFLNFYVLSATTTENDIVSNNNISVTFPNVDVNATGPWTSQLGTLVSGTTTSIKSFSTNRVRIKLLNNLKITSIMIHKSFNSSTGYSIVFEHWDYGNLTNGFPAYTDQVQYVDPDTLYESTGSPNKLLTLPSGMLVDTYNWNFATVNVQAQSDGGGKPRRYPIISTNLFDRQRSIYSIGNTHKDEYLFL